ncbi:ABC transporter related protein [Anaerovibrio sp. JC8]|uniref:ABC transporter ATP-binding protein n=1 Tax=Anaerovibrio sp. JC8 TaxID=1240085 RepID=UPI000A0B56E5|nr:ABC transporter ATP-binding protein [Anaerovibrio sp. JC8]ORT99153.1 ABC transporter related protein [Anaerovibrio sp. JC8]
MEKILSASNITTGYDKNIVITDASFDVGSGEFVGIIGKNGAGKSTLLKSLRGFLPLEKGSISLFDKDIRSYSQRELAVQIAYLQQQVEMTFDYTARDMVMAGRYPYMKWWEQSSDRDQEIIDACMKYTGVMELADTPIKAMSGGQRQRVYLAKVLAQQTHVLFLDEPASGLDLFYQEEIFRFCQEMCRYGKTVIMVVHELNLAARYCSRLMLLKEGTIIADGKPAEVLTDSLLTQAYGVDIRSLVNKETGHVDIFTVPAPDDGHKKELIETIIGDIHHGKDGKN